MKLSTTILIAAMCSSAFAQTELKRDYSADTKTIDSTVKSLYDVISGAAGQKRDWDRFRNLFAKGARLIPTYKQGEKTVSTSLSPDDYVIMGGPLLEKDGFFESEIGRKLELYGPIAQVFSSYESKKAASDEKPFERGINSIQLSFDGKRWWIQSVLWAAESAAGPIPEEFIKK